MRFSTAAIPFMTIGYAMAGPISPRWGSQQFPLSDGFPNPSPQQLSAIEAAAGGALPNSALATSLTDGASITFQLIAINEIFEVFYFNELLKRINCNGGSWSPGQNPGDCAFAMKTFTRIRAQEELHAIGANAILSSANRPTVAPCQFAFPPTSYIAAVTLANTFTDVVLSVLPVAQLGFAKDNNGAETNYVQLVGSIIAQEGGQNGWFRSVQNKVPSAAPFLTTSAPSFAFSFLKSVVIGSCPVVDRIAAGGVKSFPPLTLASASASDGVACFYVQGDCTQTLGGKSVAYLTGALKPIVQPIITAQNSVYRPSSANKMTKFCAPFDFNSQMFSDGLTVAAVVNGGSFADANAVAAATLYGPGIIELN